MNVVTARCLAIAASFLPCIAAAQQSAPVPQIGDQYVVPTHTVSIGDRRLALRCMGSGGPTVLLADGIGGWSISWYAVQPVIARRTRVCAFDRAGFGDSDAPPRPQSVGDVVGDLHAALRSAGIAPPYVVVGQALGGLEMRWFASRWPREVAGMVMIDTSFAGQRTLREKIDGLAAARTLRRQSDLRQCFADAGAGALQPGSPRYAACVEMPFPNASAAFKAAYPRFFRPSYFASSLSLPESLRSKAYDAADRLKLGTRPITVLTSSRAETPTGDRAKFEAVWQQIVMQRNAALAALSTNGVHQIVPSTGLATHVAHPDIVITAIEGVLAKLSAPPPR